MKIFKRLIAWICRTELRKRLNDAITALSDSKLQMKMMMHEINRLREKNMKSEQARADNNSTLGAELMIARSQADRFKARAERAEKMFVDICTRTGIKE